MEPGSYRQKEYGTIGQPFHDHMTALDDTSDADAPGPADEVITADDLRNSDIVYFERVAPNRVVVRAMTQDLIATHPGRIFVVRLAGPGLATFHEVSRDDVE